MLEVFYLENYFIDSLMDSDDQVSEGGDRCGGVFMEYNR